MPTSPSSSVQAARTAVASRLCDIRLNAGITGRELAVRCGWSESKSSRIENGKTPPADADIRAWCTACGADGRITDLIAANRNADSMYVEWRRLQRTGLRHLQESSVPLYRATRRFRAYCSNVVPGFLQTSGYAAALLSSIAAFRHTPNDVSEAVASRLARSQIIYEPDHSFALLIEESVLHYQIGDPGVMAGQLGHLLAVMSLPSVSLGIIPFGRRRNMWAVEMFTMFDESRVHVELLSAAVTVTAPGEISDYQKAFGEFSKHAVYGASARSLITSAVDSLG
ncbi:helix-turn-helix domain-containing protein [Streptomyces sp. BE303]|uniref:helix-turn-helix domain-containing protein n=1 Tax=Streptomyces sp. BE303 TaxID=3002528 RepID=UPI002E78BB02|nr:helix-turn-helix transcriptional regulator [Streptomyces sp. BE303]MED7948031.1 helix-turn-helix transcriptional regulator [Streptomyces sp. BE303]